MIAAIRDASVGEGHRIRGAIQAIRVGRLYPEFARVAHFETEGMYGGCNMYAGGQNLNALNQFWFPDLEDFGQGPVHSVKRSYSGVPYTHDVRQSIERFWSLEAGVSDADHRRRRLLSVETTRLVEPFGAKVVHVSSGHIATGVNFYGIGRSGLRIYSRVEGPETRSETRVRPRDLAGNGPVGTGVVIPDAPDKVPVPDDVEGILAYLRNRGLDDLASELEYQKILIEEDPDDLSIHPESARGFAGFVALESLAGSPNVTVDADGHVGLEWVIPDLLTLESEDREATTGRDDDRVWGKGHGVLGLWFLPSGMVRVYGTSGPVGQGVERMRVNCTVTHSHVMNAIEPFLSRLEDV